MTDLDTWMQTHSTPATRKRNDKRVTAYRRAAATPGKPRHDANIGKILRGVPGCPKEVIVIAAGNGCVTNGWWSQRNGYHVQCTATGALGYVTRKDVRTYAV